MPDVYRTKSPGRLLGPQAIVEALSNSWADVVVALSPMMLEEPSIIAAKVNGTFIEPPQWFVLCFEPDRTGHFRL